MEHFQLKVHDNNLREQFRQSDDFLGFVHRCIPPQRFKSFEQQRIISSDFMRFYFWLSERQHRVVFRGVSHHGYKLIAQHGNDKTMQNSSEPEIMLLRQFGLRPEDIIYAAPYMHKAWEFVRDAAKHEEPGILLIYDVEKLQQVPDKFYMFKLKPQYHTFLQALEAVVFVYFN